MVGHHRGWLDGGGIGDLGEGGGGQGGLDRAVDRRQGVDGRELVGGGGFTARVREGLGGGLVGDGPRPSSEARARGAHDRGPGIGGLDAAGVGARDGGRGDAAALAVHAAIPPVLDGVVAAVAQAAGDLCPTLAHLIHHALDHQALVGRDGFPVQRGLEVLVEALTALLGRAEVHLLRDADPVVGALFAHELQEQLVFFGDPRSTTMRGRHGVCVGGKVLCRGVEV